jgi:hypothetical protein
MHFVSLIRWWYGIGWLDQLHLVQKRFDRTADYFSIELSLKSFFKPFRQIDADRARKGSLDVILRTLFDQLFSRFIGSFARGFLIVLGSIAIALEACVGVIRLAAWPILPFLILVGTVLAMSGWVPWQ